MAKYLKRDKLKYTKKMRKREAKRKNTKRKNTKRKIQKGKNTKRKYNKVNKNILNLNNRLIRIKKQRGGDPPAQRDNGSVINGYEIVEELGKGSYCRVYKVTKNRKHYALKEMKPYEGVVGELEYVTVENDGTYNLISMIGQPDIKREIKCLSILKNSPGVSRIEETFEEDGSQFVCLDFYSGGDLSKYAFPQGDAEKIPLVFHISRQLLVALQSIHNEDIVHLDLKPENIMVNGNEVFISDFGMSMHRGSDISEVSQESNGVIYRGTPVYMDPLMFSWVQKGDLHEFNDYKLHDIFSLGCILHSLYENILIKKGSNLNEGGFTEPQRYLKKMNDKLGRFFQPEWLNSVDSAGRQLAEDFTEFRGWLDLGTEAPPVPAAAAAAVPAAAAAAAAVAVDKFFKICLGLMDININGETKHPEADNRYTIQQAIDELYILMEEYISKRQSDPEATPIKPFPPKPVELEPEPEEGPDWYSSEAPKLEFLLKGYCYKQKPTLKTWPQRYMVLFRVIGDNDLTKEIKLYFYKDKDEAVKDQQKLAQGKGQTVKRGSSITDLTLYTYRQDVENFPTIDILSGGRVLDKIILEKKEGEKVERASNNIVSLAFRSGEEGWVKKDDLLTIITELERQRETERERGRVRLPAGCAYGQC